MTRPLALRSDFTDFYDTALDAAMPGVEVWHRFSRTTWRRRDDFRAMQEAGLVVPINGTRELMISMADHYHFEKVVIYDDETAHRGEGKRLGRPEDIAPGQWASAYHDHWGRERARSYRCVALGADIFLWFAYSSSDLWRSNAGEVTIRPCEKHGASEIHPAMRRLQAMRGSPLVAVDFVDAGRVSLLAVDLNTAPGLTGTVSEIASGLSVADALRRRWVEIVAPPVVGPLR